MGRLNVLYQSSSLYVIPAAISICSMLENNQDVEYIKVWFIDDGLTDIDKENLNELVKRYDRELEYIDPKKIEKFLDENHVNKWNGAFATFYKLFVQNQIDGVDRLIYIDSDTIVNGSLNELNDIDLDGYACGMVASPMSKYIRDYLEVDPYFNGGFEVYNMDYWKNNKISEELLQNIKDEKKRFKYTIVADETLINKTLPGRIKKLPLKFNYEASWWFFGGDKKIRKELGWNDGEGFYSIEEVKSSFLSPVIMHYTNLTTGRPWDSFNDHPFRKDFKKYEELLRPWKKIEISNRGFGGNNKALLCIKFILIKIMPRFIRRRLGFNQHNQACKKMVENVKDK